MASCLLFALLVFAWLYAPAVLAAAGTCDSGAAPFALGITQCPPGFYCPFADGSTQVESCTPTADCTKLRLSSQFCEPQGTTSIYRFSLPHHSILLFQVPMRASSVPKAFTALRNSKGFLALKGTTALLVPSTPSHAHRSVTARSARSDRALLRVSCRCL